MALVEVNLSSKHLLFAFERLSTHVKITFSEILPLKVFTVGGAMVVIILGFRPTTHDIDVSSKLLEASYAKIYPNIKS